MGEEKKRTAREIIENYDGPAVRIMEVCGTHTHEIFRLGIRKLLPAGAGMQDTLRHLQWEGMCFFGEESRAGSM